MMVKAQCTHESFELAKVFRISRGAKTKADVVVVVVTDGTHFGWGEAVPYNRYGESIDSVITQLHDFQSSLSQASVWQSHINRVFPPGSARNALDCALWDLRCKQENKTINQLIDLPQITSCITAQTLSVDSAAAMQKEAKSLGNADLVKIKLDSNEVLEKMRLIHETCPSSRFIIDANEGWTFDLLTAVAEPLKEMNVVLLEQPLPAQHDELLRHYRSPIPICADESCHTSTDLTSLSECFDFVNIKLDKTGGLTEALVLLREAKRLDLGIMVGCMVGTSLAMSPAFALCSEATFVDLDGPLLVAEDRANGFQFENGKMTLNNSLLWGKPDGSNSLESIRHALNGSHG